VQHLQPEDDAMRLEFCHWVNANHQLLRLILFTDEATFTLEEINNTRKAHWWSEENPYATVKSNFQHRLSANARCGIIDSQLTGPALLEYRLTDPSYREFLRNE
jgi:hypothetical protein